MIVSMGSSGEILSTKYWHHFMIKIEFSWIYQMQLGVWGAVVSLRKDLGGEALRKFFEIYTSNGLKINAKLPDF